ncbi:Putative uncharacterized protein [Escherichia coli D6-117.29]|nr:Putative uncharacterized protein [Escherichia coli D6-117.29]
MSRDVN